MVGRLFALLSRGHGEPSGEEKPDQLVGVANHDLLPRVHDLHLTDDPGSCERLWKEPKDEGHAHCPDRNNAASNEH